MDLSWCPICNVYMKPKETFTKDLQDHCGKECEDYGEFYILYVDNEQNCHPKHKYIQGFFEVNHQRCPYCDIQTWTLDSHPKKMHVNKPQSVQFIDSQPMQMPLPQEMKSNANPNANPVHMHIQPPPFLLPPPTAIRKSFPKNVSANNNNSKKYVCQWNGCGYKAKTRSIMDNHMRKHSAKKLFICPHQGCDKQYKAKSSLKVHIRNIHEKIPYKCKQCGVEFKHLYLLLTQQKTVHEGNKYKVLNDAIKERLN